MGLAKIKITRQWKRDGTKNYMDMEAAVANLRANGCDENEENIIADLEAGEAFVTEHAVFFLDS